ncbi:MULTISPECIES: hypothetical protein [Cyanophyceae]|uniref:hypothetical protein n=1 Tax=Cyanophyceae TaxID=3028117 RepID=UPI0016866A9F|nr:MULTISPECIES: hypothetical protein [Cyanophyceae]MBD1918847.1 hypothetical protein [Phormidium sp. FACHB-77]MBD2033310.1 hypothetical protein [Phormidium sp. FACHB-322]MBD2053757.1 hypothetical protein [Leptolyngbya sp. FACHB-60]
MALGELRLGIPGNTFSSFTTTTLPSVTLNRSPAGTPLALRSELGYAELSGRSNRGTAQISGPAYAPTYAWAVAALVTLDEALQIGALAKWQDAAFKAKTDGALRLIDETELLDPEPNPHSRVLLQVLTPEWAPTYRNGYGIFAAKLQLPQDWRQQVGRWSTGEEARLVTFSVLEI